MKSSIGERFVALLAAILCVAFGIITWGDPPSTLSIVLFGAALILVLVAITGQGAVSGGDMTSRLTAALLGYGGVQLIRFARAEYRKSARMVDPGHDFVIQGVLATAGAVLVAVAVFVVARRPRAGG